MIAGARRLAAQTVRNCAARALNNALTQTLFHAALLAALAALAPVLAAEPPRVVRLIVDQAYGYRERTSMEVKPIAAFELPLAELAADLLVGAGVEPVGAEAPAFDATLTITAKGEALGTLYFDQEARFLYTGANLRGALAFERAGATEHDVAFVGQINRQRRIERDLGYADPANAPFDGALRAPGSYMDRLVELIGAMFGAPALAAALLDGDPRLRPTAARVLGDLGDATIAGDLVEALNDSDDEVRWQSAWSLGRLGHAGAVEPLIAALGDRNPDVRWFAAWSLGVLTGETFGEDEDAWAAWYGHQAGN